jgi:hypothetical protein
MRNVHRDSHFYRLSMDFTTIWKLLCILITPAPRICCRESERSDRIQHMGRSDVCQGFGGVCGRLWRRELVRYCVQSRYSHRGWKLNRMVSSSEVQKRAPDAKSSAVYGSRTHDFCLSILARVASIWEGSVLNH